MILIDLSELGLISWNQSMALLASDLGVLVEQKQGKVDDYRILSPLQILIQPELITIKTLMNLSTEFDVRVTNSKIIIGEPK